MPHHLLLVDDEDSILSMLRIVLESEGHTVSTARSVAEAAAALESGSFDVVVTDMKMEKETDGYEVARLAKERPNRPAVLILTAYPLLAQSWREMGANAVLPKPARLEQLLETVETLGRSVVG